uniref:RUN and SH3 domain-containing protein 1 isoform X1 n=1 Tax=Jaculus jaculus TaxID=51337 RepID=UPI001E1B5BD6|nr:RUN and SH3 domain-containing protein 1 isoform X1 [Jaculus jaculus]
MLSPQRALLCNLNHIHLQHVSLGLHLSRHPELREGPLSTSPPTGGKESQGPCSRTLVDANSNSPAVPCRCCQEHGSSLENLPDPSQEEGAASPSDPGCSSSLSSCSDLSPDESPVSVYSRDLPGHEVSHPQPSVLPLEQGSSPASAGPGTCSPDSFCCSPDSCSRASSSPSPGLDSNCNALTTGQDLPSPGLDEEDNAEQDLATSELSEAEDGKIDSGKVEPSWKINPIWKIDTERTEAGWKINNHTGWKDNGNTDLSWKKDPRQYDSCLTTTNTGINDSGSKTDAGEKNDGAWRGDVSEEPVPHRTITSFHELAQKRKRGPGLPLVPQAKKDRSDWLIVFSPDSELPPPGSLGPSPAPSREVTTFKELRSRSRAPPPPVPPRDPPAGWALVPPRPPPPPVPPRRKKNRPGLQPIAEKPPEEARAVSPEVPEVPAAEEPPEPGAEVRSSWSFAGVPGAQRLWMAEARSGTGQLQEQKKGLLIAVSASVDKIISHFGAARNLVQKAQLGDSRLSPDVGHLVLTTLCPALHALVADGLKPFRKDLITGQRRSSPWNVVEASVKPGSCTSSLGSLYSQVRRLAPLSSSRSRFHAFILGLLNTKQLELWFSSLQEDAGLLSLLYLPTGFFSLACGGCPSLATELLLLLQPLSVFTFHLDLLFEHHHHLPLAPPQAPAGPAGPPPALQQTVQAVLHWGSRLAQSLWGAPAEATQGPLDPPKSPPPGSWWDQLTQASRVYASGGTQGFPVLRWGPTHHESAAEDAQEIPPPTEQATAGRGMWLGRLFGVPGSPTETESGAFKSRRPSRWLPPTVSVLALMKRGIPPETPSPEELVASPASMGPADRAVRALCDHTAAGPDQLSFRRGDMLRVIATVDEDWLRCGRDGVEGLVPVGYTSLVL